MKWAKGAREVPQMKMILMNEKNFWRFGMVLFGIVLIFSIFKWSFDRTILLFCAFMLIDMRYREELR